MKGFVDLQVNGYGGVDFSAPGLVLDGVRQVVNSLAALGTVAFCPTLITSSQAIYESNLPVLAGAIEEPDLAPHLLGIHLEGPFLSPLEGARGAHDGHFMKSPDLDLYDRLHELAGSRVALVTVAPELPGAGRLIEHVRGRGAVVAIGHHLANRHQIAQACDAGASASTHLGNGIPNTLARHPNPLWDQLDEDRLTAMVITDGHHVQETFVRVVARVKGGRHFIAVSDSAPAGGLPPGRYHVLGQEAVLEPSGKFWNPSGNHLVGSSYCLLECLNYLAGLAVFSEAELWQVGMENPLRLLGQTLDPAAFESFSEPLFEGGLFVCRPRC